MGRKKPTHSELKNRCVKFYIKGEDPKKLSKLFGITERTLYNWLREYRYSISEKDFGVG